MLWPSVGHECAYCWQLLIHIYIQMCGIFNAFFISFNLSNVGTKHTHILAFIMHFHAYKIFKYA